MDDLDLIRNFREEIPFPDEAARGKARARLTEAMVDRPRSAVRIPGGLRFRIAYTAGFLAALVAIWSLVVSPVLLGGQTSAAARVLRQEARTALAQHAQTLQGGEYAYTHLEGSYFNTTGTSNGTLWGALVLTNRESWIALDGSGRIVQHASPPRFLVPGDRARWRKLGSPPLSLVSDETYEKHFAAGGLKAPFDIDGLRQAQLLRLSGNPDGLTAAIKAVAEESDNPLSFEMLNVVSDILGQSAAPPELRATLYQVAAAIPGIQLIGTVRDRAGRTGTAVSADRSDLRLEVIFDPATSAILATQLSLLQPVSETTAPSGTSIEYTLYLRSGIVPSTTATPTASTQP